MRKRIGEYLIQAGLITDADLRAALEEHRRSGEPLGVVLVRLTLVTEQQVAKALASQLDFPYVDPTEEPPEAAAIELIPKTVALARVCVVLKRRQNELTVAMADPLLFSVVQDLEFQTGHRVRQVVAAKTDIVTAIHAGYPDGTRAPIGAIAVAPPPAAPQPAAPQPADDGGANSDVTGAPMQADDDVLLEDDATDEGRESLRARGSPQAVG